MATINGFKDLVAWQRGMDLVVAVYEASRLLPADERFGLTAQMRRAAVSVPANIAEGYGRRARADYVRFVDIARGSANELETHLLISVRLGFLTDEQTAPVRSLVHEVQRITKGLVDSLAHPAKDSVRA
jgi:four helix bundle protein